MVMNGFFVPDDDVSELYKNPPCELAAQVGGRLSTPREVSNMYVVYPALLIPVKFVSVQLFMPLVENEEYGISAACRVNVVLL
jgi:hypothetical protein